MATRFEIRSPNPHTNTYIALAAIYQCMLDGISFAVRSGCQPGDLEKEFCKAAGEPAAYLRPDRMYRSEDDVFQIYSEDERDQLFGKPPATVYETLRSLLHQDEGLAVLCQGDVFNDRLLSSYSRAMLDTWEMELRDRLLQNNLARVRACVRVHGQADYDDSLWSEINALRQMLARDTHDRVCLFNEIRQALDSKNLRRAAMLQQDMDDAMHRLEHLYARYLRNQLD
jgi:glutamine synthetase